MLRKCYMLRVLRNRWMTAIAIFLAIVVLIAVFIGPWVFIGSRTLENKRYVVRSLESIDRSAVLGNSKIELEAGWAEAALKMPEGTPLAGYGDRKGRPSDGARDTKHRLGSRAIKQPHTNQSGPLRGRRACNRSVAAAAHRQETHAQSALSAPQRN